MRADLISGGIIKGLGDAVISGIHFDGYDQSEQGGSVGKWYANNLYLLLSCEVAGSNGVAYADRHGTGNVA